MPSQTRVSLSTAAPTTRVENLINAVAVAAELLPSAAIAHALEAPTHDARRRQLTAFTAETRSHLQSSWRFYFTITVVNSVVATVSLIVALFMVAVGNLPGTALLGTVTGTSLLGAALWKPHAKLLAIQAELFRISALSTSLDALWRAIDDVADPELRARLASRAINQLAEVTVARPAASKGA
jgi:hypothetical protein